MKICSTADLREKEVINLSDGERLGYVTEFEIEICEARVTALIIPAEIGFFGCPKGEGLVIPWEKIECIGEDTILVRVNVGELHRCEHEKKKHKKRWF
jgi:YlmC/YmxH family sporulation protein